MHPQIRIDLAFFREVMCTGAEYRSVRHDRHVNAGSSSSDLLATLAPPAPASHRDGSNTADARGKMVFEGACVSCYGWTGESSISPFRHAYRRLGGQ
jgi:hypothetical protein